MEEVGARCEPFKPRPRRKATYQELGPLLSLVTTMTSGLSDQCESRDREMQSFKNTLRDTTEDEIANTRMAEASHRKEVGYPSPAPFPAGPPRSFSCSVRPLKEWL